ncbi:MAG: AAA family ATPase [Alphaproteobacteria bacterium]|nr:MAG: AAA family ATPase [Alphaproteobacteria bacterium]
MIRALAARGWKHLGVEIDPLVHPGKLDLHPGPAFTVCANLMDVERFGSAHLLNIVITLKAMAKSVGARPVLDAIAELEGGLDDPARDDDEPWDEDAFSLSRARALLRAFRRRRTDELEEKLARIQAAAYGPGPLNARPGRFLELEGALPHIADAFGLDETEEMLFHLMMLLEFGHGLRHAYAYCYRNLGSIAASYAAMLGLPRSEVAEKLRSDATLQRAGLVQVENHFNDIVAFGLTRHVNAVLEQGEIDRDALIDRLVGKPSTGTLEEADFAHLGATTRRLVRLLSEAGRRGERGINVLLYGPPGTGKTEYAHVLAKLAGLPLHAVGEKDSDGDEPTRAERLGAYKTFQHLMAPRAGEVLCMVDEAEDMFGGMGFLAQLLGIRPVGSKVFANRLFEQNAIPTIWIVNLEHQLPETIRRRMNMAVRMELPPAPVRERILGKILDRTGASLDAASRRRIARDFPVPPAVLARAAKAAALGDPAEFRDSFTDALEGLAEVLGVSTSAAPGAFAEAGFDPALSEASLDLEKLLERLAATDKPFSLLLHGVPGTGKSAFAAHLAAALGLEPVKLRASDLLSKYVGESEKKIRRAFADARRRRNFLILDEADSLLRDRKGAARSWEVSQVNELLVAMERHPLPFACTTNLVGGLDEAALRRFTFSIEFHALPGPKAALCFEHFFGLPAPAAIGALEGLVPADFGIVRRKAEILGTLDQPDALARMLAEELAKRGGAPRPMGFRAPGREAQKVH